MKRLLFVLVAVLLAASAFAADANDHDVLIMSDGTMYSVTAEPSEDGLSSSLTLTVQSAGKTAQTTVVPESLSGINGSPTLAYDADSKSLFVVWIRMPNDTSSELLVAGYRVAANRWEPASLIDSGKGYRSNVTIRFTRQLSNQQRDGSYADSPALVLHAAWILRNLWGGETPRYAAMALTHGFPSEPDVIDLSDLVNSREIGEPMAPEFMRHVALLAGATPNSVDVVFADRNTYSFYRMNLRPIADGRVHITVGAQGPRLGGPKANSVGIWNGQPGTISSGDGGTLIFTNVTDTKVKWITLRNSEWLPAQEVALSSKVTVSSAMSALAKLAAGGTE